MLEKNFEPELFEKNLTSIDQATRNVSGKPFMILLPPPNITGSLHIGHALCYTLQDIIARYKRLKGYNVLFQPGLDHAGIVTQLLVEKKLSENGIEKRNLTREAFLDAIWNWKNTSGDTILSQMKTLGISCDFSKLRFTLDECVQSAVAKMFVKLYNDGLLYKAKRMINWDTVLCSAISDLEAVEKELNGNMWYIKYYIKDSDDYLTIATTRPETMFGDTAVAVNPKDDRYKHLIGKYVQIPLINKNIPVIADDYADLEKGTGAVKITPAHDFNDYEVGQRHNLPIIEILNEKGQMNHNVPEQFQNLDRFDARKLLVSELEKCSLLVKIENIKHTVPVGDRSASILEPRLTEQWFINMEKLAIPAIKAVQQNEIQYIPKHWENLYFEWLKNIKPWCISRQIWWGHRIPVWYGEDGAIFAAENYEAAILSAKKHYGNSNFSLKQDEDVLDTWFSSAMWPFVTLGWPEQTPDLEKFLSNMLVVSGFDIIFFWISRMIMFTIYATNKIPFNNIYIHGLVRDNKGQKMSKSKGNVIDPLILSKKYGADAVRFTLAYLASPGRDIKMNEQSVEFGRNFLTKLWNATRFAQMNECFYDANYDINSVLHTFSKWIVSETYELIQSIDKALENYRFDESAQLIYHFIWDVFCGWYMEMIKPSLQDITETQSCCNEKAEIQKVTGWIIIQLTKLLYSFAPFISVKISSELGNTNIEWSNFQLNINAQEKQNAYNEVNCIQEIVSAVRSMRQYLQIPFSQKLDLKIESENEKVFSITSKYSNILFKMAGIRLTKENLKAIPVPFSDGILHLCFDGEIDYKSEISKLEKQINSNLKIIESANNKLNNEDFIKKASGEIIDEHRNRVRNLSEQNANLEKVITTLKDIQIQIV